MDEPMADCPEHPGVLLEKTMEKAFKRNGVWYPGFKCPVDGKVFDYEQIMGEKARLEYAKWDYINEGSIELMEKAMERLFQKRRMRKRLPKPKKDGYGRG
jgi:hypothetical protein